jgi:hypothetical protein
VWIEVTLEGEDRALHTLWVEHATGRVVGDDPGDLSKYPDLDAPELWAPLCPPLRCTPSPIWTPEEPNGLRWIAPEVKGNHALAARFGRPILRTCGSAKKRVLSRSFGGDNWSLSANRVTWTDTRWIGDGATVRETVRTLDLSTGRVRSWAFGDKPDLYVVHTRRHLFVDDERRAAHFRRYAIDLSQP